MGSIKKAFDLTGKNALVTGGSRGLGLQIAEALGEQGARVVISSRKAPDLEKAQAHLAGLGIKAEWIAADNSRDEDVKRLSHEAIKKLGRVDILVNNAGATWGSPTEDHPIEAWVARRGSRRRQICLGWPPAPSLLRAICSIPSFGIAEFAVIVLISDTNKNANEFDGWN